MWLARDEDGDLSLYVKEKPYKDCETGMWMVEGPLRYVSGLANDMYPEVKWSDEEPTEIKLVKK